MAELDKRPFVVIAAEEVQDYLRTGLKRADNYLARAVAFDQEKALCRQYDWGSVIFRENSDSAWLDVCYLDESKRDVDELALMAISGCRIEAKIAEGLINDIAKILDDLQGVSRYSGSAISIFRAALGCVARLNIWLGRIDFTSRAKVIHWHEKRMAKINSEKGAKRNSGAAEYREAVFDLMFRCLDSGLLYLRWTDIIDENLTLFEDLNKSFSDSKEDIQKNNYL